MQRMITAMVTLVVCSAIISTGIFLGLKQQTVIHVTTPQARVSAEPVTAAMATPNVETEQRTATAALKFMEAQRSALSKACRQEKGAPVSLEMRLIFNEDGNLISYAVNDPEEASHLEVARCVREHRPSFSVEAPGRSATVQFFLSI